MERELRCQKASASVYKVFYYMITTVWAYSILRHQPYLPPVLGGKGDFKYSFTEFPFANHPSQMREYFLVTSGYHFAGLLIHFLRIKRNDFIEMGLHHIIALYLFGGGYLLNAWEIGAVIAFLHDIADIFVSIVKFLAETKYNKRAAHIMWIVMFVWFYTRIYALA